MKLFFVILFFFVIASLFGCKPEVIPPVYPPTDTITHTPALDTSYFAPAWQKPIGIEYAGVAMKPIIFGDKVLYTRMFAGPDSILRLYEGATGKLVWSWQHPAIRDGEEIADGAMYLAGNRFLVGAWHKTFSIDAATGQTQWYTNMRLNYPNANGNPRMWLQGEILYHSLYSQGAPFCDSAFLVRTNIAAGKWDTLLTLSNPKTYPSIESLTSYVDEKGDTILFFQNRQMLRTNTYPRMDVMGFNLRTRSIVWQQDSIDPEGNSSVTPALYYEGNVFFCGMRTLYCLDAKTGEIRWKKRFEGMADDLLEAQLLIADGKLIFKPSGTTMLSCNPATGSVFWQLSDAATGPRTMVQYKKYIIYVSSGAKEGIWVHRLSDGKLMHRFQSPNKAKFSNAYITTGLAIDEQRGLLFTSDDYYMMCLRMKF